MARLFTQRVLNLLAHSVQHFIIAIVIFCLAIALTYVEDFCVKYHRPQWLVWGISILSVWMFIVDAIVLGSIIAIVGYRLVREFASETSQE